MKRLLRRLRRPRRAPVILMYHRIARPARDTWALSVSPERFRDHLAALRAGRTPVSMTALVDALDRGEAADDAAALTFDDGYLDNLTVAKPLLEAAGVPATVYLATGWIGCGRPFWWDELELILFGPEPADFSVTIGGERVAISLPLEATHDPIDWRFGRKARTVRQKAYARLWTRLRDLAPDERAAAMDELRRQAPSPRYDREAVAMNANEAARLTSLLVDVGAHGITHSPLTKLPVDARRSEIAESGREAARMSGRPASGFAYPHGDRDRRTRGMVREAGYRYACSTFAAAIDCADYDVFDLPRLMVEDWTAQELISRMEALRT